MGAALVLDVRWRLDCPHCGRFLAACERHPGLVRVYCKQCRAWVEPSAALIPAGSARLNPT